MVPRTSAPVATSAGRPAESFCTRSTKLSAPGNGFSTRPFSQGPFIPKYTAGPDHDLGGSVSTTGTWPNTLYQSAFTSSSARRTASGWSGATTQGVSAVSISGAGPVDTVCLLFSSLAVAVLRAVATSAAVRVFASAWTVFIGWSFVVGQPVAPSLFRLDNSRVAARRGSWTYRTFFPGRPRDQSSGISFTVRKWISAPSDWRPIGPATWSQPVASFVFLPLTASVKLPPRSVIS